jgi:predicted DNA binding CopG/RHH family protein
MEKRKIKTSSVIPNFANEREEAKWWASAAGRRFVKEQAMRPPEEAPRGSKLVAKLARADSVQIALRLPSPDLAKARAIAERKGIGYQTLLKMIVHEGLQRVERQR